MSETVWIKLPTLTKREGELWRIWQERMHEIYEQEGKRLELYGDAIPVLVGLIHEHYPKAGIRRRVALMDKLAREHMRALQLYHRTGGSA